MWVGLGFLPGVLGGCRVFLGGGQRRFSAVSPGREAVLRVVLRVHVTLARRSRAILMLQK